MPDKKPSAKRADGPLDFAPRDERVISGLLRLDPEQVRSFRQQVAAASGQTGLDYIKDSGERVLIPINPVPAMPTRRQLTYLSGVLKTLAGAVARVAARRLDDVALAQALPLGEAELPWLRLAAEAPGSPVRRVFHRWDLAFDLAGDPTATGARFFEVNSVDVGGIHYAAAAREVLCQALPAAGIRGISLKTETAGADPRRVLLAELRSHARKLGHTLRFVAIAEQQDFDTGITEAPSLAAFFESQGVAAACVDVRHFEVRSRKGVCVRGRPVDAIYRNIELRDLADLEAAGADLSGLRAAALAGLLLSSPYGELDHKSLWEVLGSPEHAARFSLPERKLIARHIPWTRLLRERKTTGRSDEPIDLPRYVRRQRTSLVLKPNRSCGGQGVTIGAITSQATWDNVLDQALASPDTWVAQDLIPLPRRRTVTESPDGRFVADTVYAVYGLFHSAGKLAFVGRASHSPVVNVMQGGGMLGVVSSR